MKNFSQWEGFKGNRWKEKIDVRNFISMNYTPYDGDASFLGTQVRSFSFLFSNQDGNKRLAYRQDIFPI